MTALVARLLLQNLPMSAVQSGSRRLSARLQEKGDSQQPNNGKQAVATAGGAKKRKIVYDEEDDGFTFSRVKKSKRPRQSSEKSQKSDTIEVPPKQTTQNESRSRVPLVEEKEGESASTAALKSKRKRMSFSTPKVKDTHSLRRSKRLSNEATEQPTSPMPNAQQIEVRKRQKAAEVSKRTERPNTPEKVIRDRDEMTVQKERAASPINDKSTNSHGSTKIALPVADTPVIRRNKDMREGRGRKSERRRSSLGLRGRRASSLIDSGSSNALPHSQVDTMDFYKHIESDLLELKRMRQLLTWCATRAMHAKPQGTNFQESSAKSAVRVIEEELLKELSQKPELSDWFGREEIPEMKQAEPLPERPNPKNIHNIQKISELEQSITRLKAEKAALEALLKPPEVPDLAIDEHESEDVLLANIDRSLLSSSDTEVLNDIMGFSDIVPETRTRLSNLISAVGPTVDKFADGVHKIAQFRSAADTASGAILSICADRLAERERDGRKKALGTDEDRSPARDLSNVLRGLSKADR